MTAKQKAGRNHDKVSIIKEDENKYGNIPKHFTTWGEVLGTDSVSSVEKSRVTKETIKKQIKEVLSIWDDLKNMPPADIQNLIQNTMNIPINNYKGLFENFPGKMRTVEGMKEILSVILKEKHLAPLASSEKSEELQQMKTTDELDAAVEKQEDKDILPGNVEISAEQILSSLPKGIKNTKLFNECLFLAKRNLWRLLFNAKKEKREICNIRKRKLNGERLHDTVIRQIIREYDTIKKLRIPGGYSYTDDDGSKVHPNLMQMYIANKIKTEDGFMNMSGTGSGKSLSAILASRVIKSKVTLIICPKIVIPQWEKFIKNAYPDSIVVTGKNVFFKAYNKPDKNKHKYLVVNYDKWSIADMKDYVNELGRAKVDFIVLDEVQFVKIRNESVSQRRLEVELMVKQLKKHNPHLKVLGLSATPVINNIREGKSLLELVSGKEYPDISHISTVRNSVRLRAAFLKISIRHVPEYPIIIDWKNYTPRNICSQSNLQNTVVEAHGTVNYVLPEHVSEKMIRKYNWLEFEKFATYARIPEILSKIKGKTIIYTKYVDGIVEELAKALEKNHYTVGYYTGKIKSDLNEFIDKKDPQVLIASMPIASGFDGLQKVCNNLIFNSLPWTPAEFEQVVGRLVRPNSDDSEINKRRVEIHIIPASINGYKYDQKIKLNRLEYKGTIASCVVNGTLPEKSAVGSKVQLDDMIEHILKDKMKRIEKSDAVA